MIYKMELSDSVDTMVFDLLEVPIVDKDITGIAENTTIDGNVFNDYLWLKKQYVQKWSIMCQDEYDRLRGFWLRQFGNAEVPFYRLFYGSNIYEDRNFLTSDGFTQILNPTERTAPMNLTHLYGNAGQKTVSGKNKISMTPYYVGGSIYNQSGGHQFPNTQDYTNVSITSQSDSAITFTQANTTNGILLSSVALAMGDYYISGGVSATTNLRGTIYTLDNTHSVVRTIRNIQVNTTPATTTIEQAITLASGEEFIAFSIRSNTANDTVSASNFQVEAGSQKTNFVQFVGGVDSPNPDYPQTINVVSGEQTVKITGKNLADNNIPTTTYGSSSATIEQIASGVRAIYTGASTSTPARYRYYKLLSADYFIGKTLSLSFNMTVGGPSNNGGIYVGYCDDDGSNRANIIQRTTSGSASGVVPAEAQGKWLCILFFANRAGSVSQNEYVDYTNVQLEIGDATAYEPYQAQSYTIDLDTLELAKIGDYTDGIKRVGDKWYKHAEIGKLVLNGSESWSEQPTYYQVRLENSALVPATSAFSNYYTFGSATGEFYLVTSYARFRDIRSSLADYKTWLSTHNTTVYYALATPTDTEITDSDLLAQLNTISELYQGTNNLFLIQSAGAQGEIEGTYRLIFDEETDIIPKTPVVLTLTDGGVINPCGCRQNIQLIMRETKESSES